MGHSISLIVGEQITALNDLLKLTNFPNLASSLDRNGEGLSESARRARIEGMEARWDVLLPDGPGVHIAYLAAEKAGLVVVGIGVRAGFRELEHALRLTSARGLISRARHEGRSTFRAAALVPRG